MLESQILSKILDENAFHELPSHGITEKDFPTLGDAFRFIKGYVDENGAVPDYRTVVAEFKDFEYMPESSDTFGYLTGRLKAQTAKREAYTLLQTEASEKFATMDGAQFVDWLAKNVNAIQRDIQAGQLGGMDYAMNGAERAAWYDTAAEKGSAVFVPTPYPSLNKALGGGLELGDMVMLMAFTNRGKSWVASDCGLTAWLAGYDVLHYSPELSKKQQALRLDTLAGQFNNVDLRRGQLQDGESYKDFLTGFAPEVSKGHYIIKTMEHLNEGLSVDVVRADLQANPNIRMVIIDGFNLMDHRGSGGKMRDAMTKTSRQLRQVFGRYGVCGLVVHQTPGSSEKESQEVDGSGYRIVKPPRLTDYSETIALIQDCATVLTFDQSNGIGKLSIEKAREPSVGTKIELLCDFNGGIVQEQDVTGIF